VFSCKQHTVALVQGEAKGGTVLVLPLPVHPEHPNTHTQADAALLIVDGSPGGFEAGFAAAAPGSPAGGGQTREHAQVRAGPGRPLAQASLFGSWISLSVRAHPPGIPACSTSPEQINLFKGTEFLYHTSPPTLLLRFACAARPPPSPPQLARSLGIEQVAVVVTKLDTCEYSQQRFDNVRCVEGAAWGGRRACLVWAAAGCHARMPG
jgi:hypothetical protein